MKLNPLFMTDSYKLAHADMYPDGTEFVYSNFTPRSNKRALEAGYPADVVYFGLQFALTKLNEIFDEWFLLPFRAEDFDDLNPFYDVSKLIPRFKVLHELGYLPIEVRSLHETSNVNMGIPVFTITNTLKEFYWLVNYLETFLSSQIWHMTTCATIAKGYSDLCLEYSRLTCENTNHIPYQCHDFSYRGHHCVESASAGGAGHLLFFKGTDTLPSIPFMRTYYGITKEVIGCSVPATEHSVMCAGGEENELQTFERLINLYPNGILSVVSDTWDYFNTISNIASQLKDKICGRNGKLVFRPDSGDPLKIICGDKSAPADSLEYKGSLQILWEIFGGEINSKGFKVLNPKVGLIYGDSITIKRAEAILEEMKNQGFASSNIVFGIGSYTYVGSITRDTYNFAMKATAVCINGEWKAIAKNPKTGNGDKKSAKGFLQVVGDHFNGYQLIDDLSFDEYCEIEDEGNSNLELAYLNSKLDQSFVYENKFSLEQYHIED